MAKICYIRYSIFISETHCSSRCCCKRVWILVHLGLWCRICHL